MNGALLSFAFLVDLVVFRLVWYHLTFDYSVHVGVSALLDESYEFVFVDPLDQFIDRKEPISVFIL